MHRALKKQLADAGLNKLQARVCTASCLDQCSAGVAILVEPDHFFYGHVTVGDVNEIVASLSAGTRVERLVLVQQQLAKG